MERTACLPRTASAGIAGILAAFALLPSIPARAQEVFGDEVSITVVEIPVQVIADGRPVTGLTADDFEVRENGKPHPIRSFEVIDLSLGEAAAETLDALPAAGVAAPPRRHFLVLFDLLAPSGYLERARLGVAEMVESQLHASDRVAVGYLGNGVRLLTGFTADREELRLALDVVKGLLDREGRKTMDEKLRLLAARRIEATAGLDELAAVSSLVGPTAALARSGSALDFFSQVDTSGPNGADTGSSGSLAQAVAFEDAGGDAVLDAITVDDPSELTAEAEAQSLVHSSIRSLTESLGALVTLLRGLSGSRHLIFLSRGFGADAFRAADTTRMMEEMLATLRRNGWAVQAIDIGGLSSATTQDIAADVGTGSLSRQSGVPRPVEIGSAFSADSLLTMAEATGGQLIENFSEIDQATRRIVERTSVTYLLTIEVAGLEANGRYHPIEVELTGRVKGARILHRPGYYAPKPLAERSELERRLASAERLLGSEVRRELAVDVLALALPQNGPAHRVPVLIEVEGADLLDGEASELLELEIRLYALDRAERVIDSSVQRLTLDRQKVEGTLNRKGLRYLDELALPAGDYRLRVLVRNLADGKLSLSTVPLAVTALEPGAPQLLAPFFIDTAEGWLMTRKSPRVGYGITAAGRSLVPAARPRLTPGRPAGVCLLARHLDPAGSVLSSRIVSSAGEPVAGAELELLQRAPQESDGLECVVGRLDAAGLAPGDYRLEIEVSGPSGEQTSAVAFSVTPSPAP